MKIKFPAEPWMRAAVILWSLLAVAYIVKMFTDGDQKSVYPIFHTASHHWWQQENLYARYEGIDLFRYSPTFAILLTPFALLPMLVGSVVWTFFGIALLLWALHTLVRELLPGTWDTRREGMFLVLAVAGSVRGIWSGQSNSHLLALAIFAAVAVYRRQWWPAAAMLAAAFFIKLWPIALLMLLASFWPKPLIPRFMAVSAGLALIPFLTASRDWVLAMYREYYASLIYTSKLRWPGNRDAWTIWEEIQPVDPSAYQILQLATAGVVFLWCQWQRRRDPSIRRLLTLTLAAWVAWQLLFGPGTERLTYGLIAPFASWAILVSPRGSWERRIAWLAWWLTALLGTGAAERALLPVFEHAKAIQPSGVVVFILWLAIFGRRIDLDPASADPAASVEPTGSPAHAFA
ncbi:MAG: glycosyltransferase family 87 protein [Acidobacteriota bacterium]